MDRGAGGGAGAGERTYLSSRKPRAQIWRRVQEERRRATYCPRQHPVPCIQNFWGIEWSFTQIGLDSLSAVGNEDVQMMMHDPRPALTRDERQEALLVP